VPHVERRLLEVVGRLLRQCVLQFHSSKIATITTTRLSTLSTTLRFNQFFVRFVHICVVILSCGGILSYYMSTFNKSSAVAEMGDRLATVDMRRKVGRGWCGGAGSPLAHHPTQCGLGRGLPLYQVASWSIQPFGHNCRNATLLRVGIPLRTIFFYP